MRKKRKQKRKKKTSQIQRKRYRLKSLTVPFYHTTKKKKCRRNRSLTHFIVVVVVLLFRTIPFYCPEPWLSHLLFFVLYIYPSGNMKREHKKSLFARLFSVAWFGQAQRIAKSKQQYHDEWRWRARRNQNKHQTQTLGQCRCVCSTQFHLGAHRFVITGWIFGL